VSGESVTLEVSSRRLLAAVLVGCVAVEVAFVLLDFFVSFDQGSDVPAIRRLFNITREDSLPGWFGPVQTLLLGLTLWLVWGVERRRRPGEWATAGWALVASFFTYMAIDDGSKLHERLGSAFSRGIEVGSTLDAFPSYGWQLLLLPAFALLGLFTLVFLWRELGDRTGRLLLFGGIGCFAVAVGLDFVEGLDPGLRDHPYRWLGRELDLYRVSRQRFGLSPYEVIAHVSKAIEETIEMFGTTLLWIAVLRHLASRTGEIRLRLSDDRTPRSGKIVGIPR
jgi:hypothetical protein